MGEQAVQAEVDARETVVAVARAARAQDGKAGVLQVVYGMRRVEWAAHELQRNATERVQGVVKPPYSATDMLDSVDSHKLEGVDYQVFTIVRRWRCHPSSS